MLRRHGALGLRGRIVGALLVSTVVTLAVAALALFSPLERQLRDEAQSTLVQEVGGEQKAFDQLTPDDIADANASGKPPTSAPASGAAASSNLASADVDALGGRAGATISLYAYPLVMIASDAPSGSTDSLISGAVTEAFQTDRTVESFGSGSDSDVAQVAVPIKIVGTTYILAASRPITEIPGAVHVVRTAFIYAALAGIALTLILGIPLSATLLRRLQRLRIAALRLAQGGPAVEVPVDRAGDEVGDLTRTFAIMQRRLAQQEEARRKFVSTASHELRTPLAMIRSVGEVGLQKDGTRAEYRDIVGSMLEEVNRLTSLIDSLLTISRADSGHIQLHRVVVPVAALVREAAGLFEILLEEKGQRLTVEGDESAQVEGDYVFLRQAFVNVIHNAVKYSPVGGAISVRINGGDGQVLVAIHDDGPGIPVEDQLKVFDRFYRVDKARWRESGGAGLGLSIVKWTVEAHGGNVTLESGPNEGCTFRIHLPSHAA